MNWLRICEFSALLPERGTAALLPDGRQAALFPLSDGRVFALDNLDPFSGAQVLSRGVLGDRGGVATVASPMHKQVFALHSGRCLDDEKVAVSAYPVRLRAGYVELLPETA
ncbi:nitrite reductase small subunit NirD [Phytomonospora endophytica]|uniref:Nitrite reductase (NADH) small subunit n=1 Tax=Phytomonospora endophytica TaxID=714109 RepID=A0A841FCP0_9ACTN|nr:nitrite reductase small subunit NirD [Phytomonospora endophytica]MBB6033175.1 nitrite reductase (NADH) small subunit [Phytomonospora endophytica]GIG65402.1 nitrite reductase small subunit [Phytomonospora endophytica]